MVISPEASQDLEEIIDYFSNINIEAGEDFLKEFDKKCKYLVDFPHMGRSYKHIKDYLRGIPLDRYIIFYRLINNGIEIMHIVSGYRDFKSLFAE
ncbi:type II toxin-antitoxin system RelE/ParE family toxin [Nostoc sp. TCL26-01]|uniref:type II toxin-antitoxin system RelE/ParE family toxin n=1 Tax=Nostoc sp. TCL26-01 TaxID=2576904 RepID=UPI0015BBB3E4|nr:type II toxin-antitoxin system RelE/ParE family toxin [Nostoc sp. TCL26-01]QLE56672.1 type II toxin-antitoxin system RelE/ParE family toxin [Nostoc sp. TCL26-01]